MANGYELPETTFDDEWNVTPNELYVNPLNPLAGGTEGQDTRKSLRTARLQQCTGSSTHHPHPTWLDGSIFARPACDAPASAKSHVGPPTTAGQQWQEAGRQLGFASTKMGRGLAIFDYDNDGDMDVIVATLAGAPEVHVNRVQDSNKSARDWIGIEVFQTVVDDRPHLIKPRTVGLQSIGARVEVAASGTKHAAWFGTRTFFLGQSDPAVHIGLGKGSSKGKSGWSSEKCGGGGAGAEFTLLR